MPDSTDPSNLNQPNMSSFADNISSDKLIFMLGSIFLYTFANVAIIVFTDLEGNTAIGYTVFNVVFIALIVGTIRSTSLKDHSGAESDEAGREDAREDQED